MKFFRETYQQRVHRLMRWHRWFAWYPVRVCEGCLVWLQFVERRADSLSLEDHGGMVFAYRLEATTA